MPVAMPFYGVLIGPRRVHVRPSSSTEEEGAVENPPTLRRQERPLSLFVRVALPLCWVSFALPSEVRVGVLEIRKGSHARACLCLGVPMSTSAPVTCCTPHHVSEFEISINETDVQRCVDDALSSEGS